MEKILTSRSCIIVLALFLLLEAGQCVRDCRREVSQSEQEYRNYTTTYAGELTEEAALALLQEKQQIDQTMAMYESMLTMAREGTLPQEEWQAYVVTYANAYRRADAITRVVERLALLSADTGASKPWLIYDTGWQRIFQRGADIVLILTVVYLSSVIFPTEYRKRASGGAFFPLLASTKRGRWSVLLSKCATAAILGGVLTVLSQLSLLLPLLVRNEWIFSDAPLSSLALWAQSPEVTIAEYLGMCCLVRIAAILLLSVIVCLVSALLRREIFTLLLASVVLLFPHILVVLGMQKATGVDFLGLYSCTSLLALKNASIATLLYYLVILALFAGILFLTVYRCICGATKKVSKQSGGSL